MPNEKVSSFKYFIFNEEFVMKNIQFKTAGLDTIVMLRDQKELHKKSEKNKVAIEKSDRELHITELLSESRVSSSKIKDNT